jgi:tRNA acetyltransferase TAN1
MYGIKPVEASGGGDEGEDEDEDIEAAIKKEVAALTAKPTPGSAASADDGRMTPVKMNVDCLLFVKTPPAVEPVPFVRRICEDAKRFEEIPGLMRCRYVNRVTPVSVMGKANEQGLVDVAKEAMGEWFDLSGKRSLGAAGGEEAADETSSKEAAGETGAQEGEASAAESGRKPFTASQAPAPFLLFCWCFDDDDNGNDEN